MKLLKNFFSILNQEKTIIVAMFSGMATMMTLISSMQYGILIFNQSYQKDDASKDYISNRISLYLITGQVTVLILAPVIGFFVMDNFKQWKIVFVA